MAFSLKKRVQSKLHIASGGDDDANALGEVLHRSTKRSKSKAKKKKNERLSRSGQIYKPDSDLDTNTRPLTTVSPITYRSACPCDTHFDKQLLERDYELTVDKLFDLIFGTNEFVRTYRQTQRIYDDTATEWTTNEETKCGERMLNYKVPYESTLVGKATILTRENQTLLHKTAGSHYIIETEVSNEGVKYSDTFSLHIRYCLVQTSATMTNLRITAQVRFSKSVNSLAKQLIERNAYSASQESFKDLNSRLNLITNFKMEKRRFSRSETALNIPPLANERSRRMSRHDALAKTPSNQSLANTDKNVEQSLILAYPDRMIYFFIFIAGLLLFIHLYLYLKLKHMDVLVDNLSHLIKISSSVSRAKN